MARRFEDAKGFIVVETGWKEFTNELIRKYHGEDF